MKFFFRWWSKYTYRFLKSPHDDNDATNFINPKQRMFDTLLQKN